MSKKILLFIPLLSLLLISCSKGDEKSAPPPDVKVFVTQGKDVPLSQEFVGQIHGAKDIAVRARVEGFLEGIHFDEGSFVEEGSLLYTLESQPFEADVAAKMSHLASAKTMLAKAQSDLNRIRPLAKRKAVSQSDLDGAVAEFEAAEASVEASEAVLRASKIQLSYTQMLAPVSGLIGKTQAKVGDFVGRSPNPVILNTVSNIDEILVEFFLTENQYIKIARKHLVGGQPNAESERKALWQLILSDGSLYEHRGVFKFIDRNIDPTTGAILIQLSFPNPRKIIRSGQFARVKIEAERVKNGILVPQRCVTELQGLHQVMVVGEGNKVETRGVKVGPTMGSFWLIREGLEAGEKVVYEGLQLARPGAVVNPVVETIELPNFEEL